MNGNVRAVENLKQRLESGEDVDLFSACDTCTVASLLKQYLRDLPEGLIDSTVQQALIQYYQGKNKYFAGCSVSLFSTCMLISFDIFLTRLNRSVFKVLQSLCVFFPHLHIITQSGVVNILTKIQNISF